MSSFPVEHDLNDVQLKSAIQHDMNLSLKNGWQWHDGSSNTLHDAYWEEGATSTICRFPIRAMGQDCCSDRRVNPHFKRMVHCRITKNKLTIITAEPAENWVKDRRLVILGCYSARLHGQGWNCNKYVQVIVSTMPKPACFVDQNGTMHVDDAPCEDSWSELQQVNIGKLMTLLSNGPDDELDPILRMTVIETLSLRFEVPVPMDMVKMLRFAVKHYVPPTTATMTENIKKEDIEAHMTPEVLQQMLERAREEGRAQAMGGASSSSSARVTKAPEVFNIGSTKGESQEIEVEDEDEAPFGFTVY